MESRGIANTRPSNTSVSFRWLPLAMAVSLVAHIAFLWWTHEIIWTSPTSIPPPQQQTHPFRLIQPPESHPTPTENLKKRSPLEQPLALPITETKPNPNMGTLPSESSVSPPKINPALLQEKLGVVGSSLNPATQHTLSEGINHHKMDSFQAELLKNHSQSTSQSFVDLLQPDESGQGAQTAAAGRRPGSVPKGFSDLDALLSQTGPLKSDTAPILMPTDLLFDYDHAELRTQAVGSLRKLGTLIQRNPQATFLIEGHTDSFGPDEYNMDLSLRRAEAVKTWLVHTMQIASTRIETKGYGKSRLLAPASGSIEQQQINRRVEIIVHVPKHSS